MLFTKCRPTVLDPRRWNPDWVAISDEVAEGCRCHGRCYNQVGGGGCLEQDYHHGMQKCGSGGVHADGLSQPALAAQPRRTLQFTA